MSTRIFYAQYHKIIVLIYINFSVGIAAFESSRKLIKKLRMVDFKHL
jgi:hypothetical protein